MFSDSEKKIIDIIGKKKMTIAEVTDAFYEGETDTPIVPNNNVAAMIRRIKNKCDHHGLAWTLDGKGTGRQGRVIWKAKRK